LKLHQERVRGRTAVGAENTRRFRQRVDDVGDLVRDRFERRPYEVRRRRAAREAGDEPPRIRVPPWAAEPGQRGHEVHAARVVDARGERLGLRSRADETEPIAQPLHGGTGDEHGPFQRIQFTPDLVPSDLVGTRVYRPDRSDFDTELGPVFCNFLLADEINRAPAKVQSALLEVMQERQVTIGHQTFPVPSPFLVLATQNPIESEGTYPLPEAQVDRFMLKVLVDYPAHDEELTVVARSLEMPPTLDQVLSLDDLKGLQAEAADVYVDPALISWAVDVATATRRPRDHGLNDVGDYISFGASPRGPISLVASARALALIRGRDYVVPADMEALARDAFRHRLVVSYRALAEEVSPDSLLDQVLAAVPTPQIDLGRREQVA